MNQTLLSNEFADYNGQRNFEPEYNSHSSGFASQYPSRGRDNMESEHGPLPGIHTIANGSEPPRTEIPTNNYNTATVYFPAPTIREDNNAADFDGTALDPFSIYCQDDYAGYFFGAQNENYVANNRMCATNDRYE